MDRATKYAQDVDRGRILAGKPVRDACARHLRDLKEAKERGLYWDAEAVEDEVGFFSELRQSKGEWAGKPLHLEPFQVFIVASLLCWKRREKVDGKRLRRFRTGYIELARKNGKSTVAAGMGLDLAFVDGEPGAEVYSAATKKDQAKIVWTEAKRMVRKTPSLRDLVQTLAGNLVREDEAQKFEPLGADEDGMDGLNVHGAIVDELHAHKSRAVWDLLETATGSRRQPLIMAITTAGWNRQSVCWEQHEYALRVAAGIVQDDSYFSYVATIDEGDDWKDPAVWGKANPNLGVSLKLEDLQRLCDRAKEMPSAQNTFKRLRLNVWTEQSERWLDMAVWDRCDQPLADLIGRHCYGGLDLASTNDIAALLLAFPGEDDWLDLLARFWVPADSVVKRSRRGVPYDAWVRDGWIKATPGDVIDYDVIRTDIVALMEQFELREVAVDRWNATQITTQLQGEGLTMIPMGQGFASMSAPTKELATRLQKGRIRHGGNPVLRWMASNVATKEDSAGNLKPDRKRSSEKIDGIVAAIMAVDRVTRSGATVAPGVSVL